jgi:GDP-L-fucose synthase
MSRLLVTGGRGFLGSHLVERLELEGHDVVAVSSADYDLTSMDDTAQMFDDADAELIFHLAAEVGGIGANRANPGRYWYANLSMGVHMLEQARLHETPKLVLVGTVCSYPKFAPVPFREQDLWDGYPEETNAPYGIAKKAILVGAQGYREQYGLNSVFLLPANLYGPRDNFHPTNAHVIADLIRKMIEADEEGRDEVVLWGDGSPTREFLYVEDCVEGLLLAAKRYDGSEPVNLGAGKEISIRDLAELVADVTGYRGHIVWDTTKPAGQPRRSIDATRAHELFGFEARTPLRGGLERTVAWYRSARSTAGVSR